MVSTPLKNISQHGNLLQIGVKIWHKLKPPPSFGVTNLPPDPTLQGLMHLKSDPSDFTLRPDHRHVVFFQVAKATGIPRDIHISNTILRVVAWFVCPATCTCWSIFHVGCWWKKSIQTIQLCLNDWMGQLLLNLIRTLIQTIGKMRGQKNPLKNSSISWNSQAALRVVTMPLRKYTSYPTRRPHEHPWAPPILFSNFARRWNTGFVWHQNKFHFTD